MAAVTLMSLSYPESVKRPEAPTEAPKRRGPLAPPWLRNVVVDAALPWVVVQLCERLWAAPEPLAFALASLFPAASVALSWARRRSVDVVGVAVLLILACGAAVTLATGDVRFALLKAAPVFGLFGVAALATAGSSRPLMFFVMRQLIAGGDGAIAAAWTARLRDAGFRRTMQRLTLVWGVACLAEACLGTAAALLLAPQSALVAEPVLGLGTAAGLLAWSTRYLRRRLRVAAPSAAPDATR